MNSLRRDLKLFGHYLAQNKWGFVASQALVLFSSGLLLLKPWLLGELFGAITSHEAEKFAKLAVGLGALLLLLALISYFRFRISEAFNQRLLGQMKSDFLAHLLNLPQTFYDRHSKGELLAHLNSDLAAFQSGMLTLPANLFKHGVVFIGGSYLLFSLSPAMTMLWLAVLPPIVLVCKVLGRKCGSISSAWQKSMGQANELAEEALTNHRTIDLLNESLFFLEKYRLILADQELLSRQNGHNSGLLSALSPLLTNGALLVVLSYGYLQSTSDLAAAELVKFVLYGSYLGGALNGLAGVYGGYKRAAGAVVNVGSIWEEQGPAGQQSATLVVPITFEKVSFNYESRPTVPVIKDFSEYIEGGELVLVTGPSGCGKSTLLALLAGLYEPTSGHIMVGSQNLKQIDQSSWRAQLGFMAQNPAFFRGTLRENIALGRSDLTTEKILACCGQVGLLPLIDSWPEGLDTPLGSHGGQLSGGQKVRLALARALVRNPRLLLLDEPTASLDEETADAIWQTILKISQHCTTIAVTHHLAECLRDKRVIRLG